jgi:hypothetical protein
MGDIQRAAALYREGNADPVKALPQLRRAVTDPDDLVRHVASVQLAFHHPTEMTESTTRELLATLLQVSRVSDRSPLTPEYAEATDDGEDCWDLGQHIALALACLPAGSADFAVPELVALWQRDRQFYEAVLAAVALAFSEGGRPTPSALSQSQRAVLLALVGDDAVWTFCGDTAPMLMARSLPESLRGMQSFLASARK